MSESELSKITTSSQENPTPNLAERVLNRLHEQALVENEERDWQHTGIIPCSDCGTRVRTQTLETLPFHNCTQRQRARRESESR